MLVGSRRLGSSGTLWAWIVGLAGAQAAPAQEPPVPAQAVPGEAKPTRLEDEPAPFVPRTPRTAEEQERIEGLRDYVAGRALEDRRQFREALVLLEKARQKLPQEAGVLRRLSRISFALGRVDQGIAYAKEALDADPSDAETLRRLVAIYRDLKSDPAAAEAVLNGALASPKMAKASAAYLVARRDLGELFARQLNQPDRAADAFAEVVEALDDKASNKLSNAEQLLILGAEPEAAYELFGDTFLLTRRFDLAIKAYRRGLAYDPDDTDLPLRLAEALLRSGNKAEALQTVEPLLKDRPEAREPYELLGLILNALDRKAEVIPRLEALLEADAKNAPLQYVLADRYKEAGQPEKANALYERLVKDQPDPRGFAALAQSLRKEKKYEDLLKLIEAALPAPNGSDAIKPQIEALCLDKVAAAEVIDAGLKMLAAEPPGLGRVGQNALVYIANRAELPEKHIALEREALKKNPSPTGYRELWLGLYRANKFDEAADALDELLAKYPTEATPQILNMLSQTRLRAGQARAALDAAERSLQRGPNDVDALSLSAMAFTRLGRFEDAVARYRAILDRFAGNEEVEKQARSGLSNAYVEMGDFEKGEAELEILFQKMPEDPGINNDLGYLYADRGKNLEKAEAMIRKALEEEPENGSYLDSLGWVLYKRGQVKEAVEPLEKAANLQASDSTIFDHLGDVYFRLQDPARALESWEKAEALAARSDPPEKKLAEIRKKLEALKKQAAADPAAKNP